MWSSPLLPDAPSLPSTDELLGAPPSDAAAFIGGGAPTAICNGGRPKLSPQEMAVGPVAVALSNSGWSVNRPFLWRLLQPPYHPAAGSRAIGSRHYQHFKRWLQDLPPVQTAVRDYF
jgi:hypothetical protein